MIDLNLRRPLEAVAADLIAIAQELLDRIPTLGPLSLSLSKATAGEAVVVDILGAIAGETITATAPDGMTFDGPARQMTGIPRQVGLYEIVISQFLTGANGSPRQSVVAFQVEAAPPVDEEAYSWGDPRLSWGLEGIAWGQEKPDAPPSARAFFSDPFFSDPFFRTGV